MDNFKKSFKIVSEILEILVLLLISIIILTKNYYAMIVGVTISVIGIIMSIFVSEKISLKDVIKNIKIYFFIDTLLFNISKLFDLSILYVLTIIFAIILLLVSFIFLISDKNDSKEISTSKKDNKRRRKK